MIGRNSEKDLPAGRRDAGRRDAIGIGVAALAFYLLTLAPSVLWGDDAELQRLAATSGRINPGRGHLLWLAVARVVQLLPWGNPAWKANAVSALFGALTVGLILAATRRLTENRLAAIVAALSLAVSHLFWLHSVRAEVYTLHTAVVATIIWLAVLWTRNPGSGRLAFLLGLVPGLGAINHVLVATLLPAIAWLLRPRRGRVTWRPVATAAGGLALGLIPWILLQARAAIGDPFRRPFESFAPLSVTGGEIVKGLLCILYQFPLTLPFAVAGVAALALGRNPMAGFLALGIADAAGFAASFHVADQIVFYLPAS
ncbi:MAG TPA: DUF2723 domain-containing protein, partial [Candidatus Saccharimonadales bacterium]|nr:DUF2723 domain-containing protein [Candidatus Saccharimonadales bacterium]